MNRRYCSDGCRRIHNIDRVLAMYYLATSVGNVNRGMGHFRHLVEYFAHRDGTQCPLCRNDIDTSLRSGPRGEELGPSLDHIVPRSHGGEDDLANLRLTHWKCNRDRGNRGGSEQLRLVG